MTRLTTLKIALTPGFSAVAGTALAHAHLEHASPAGGASLHMAPKAVEMEFDDPVVLTKLDIKGDKDMAPLDFKRGAASTTASVALPELAMGAYAATWNALSTEDTPPKGTFSSTLSATFSRELCFSMDLISRSMRCYCSASEARGTAAKARRLHETRQATIDPFPVIQQLWAR